MPPFISDFDFYQDSIQIKENCKRIDRLFQVIEDQNKRIDFLEKAIKRCNK